MKTSRDPGLWSQPEDKIALSVFTTWELDENQPFYKQGKVICLYQMTNTLYLVNTYHFGLVYTPRNLLCGL